MKKSLLALLVMIITLSSCEGPEGPMGPPGEPGKGMEWYVEDIWVHNWTLMDDGDGSYYMAEITVPALSQFIYEDGKVSVYRYIRSGESNEVQTTLPFTLYLTERNETTYYDYMKESIAIYVQYSDFARIPPGSIEFRIVLNW